MKSCEKTCSFRGGLMESDRLAYAVRRLSAYSLSLFLEGESYQL